MSTTTLSELIERYLISCEARNLRPKSIADYNYHLRCYLDALPDDPLSPLAIEQFLAQRRTDGFSDATIVGDYRALRALFRWCVKRKLIAENPIDSVDPPRERPRIPKRVKPAEYFAILDAIPTGHWIDLRDRLIIQVLFLSGVRVGECAQLLVDDFDLSSRQIVSRDGKVGDRMVPMLEPVAKAFIAYMFARPAYDTDRIFLSATTKRTVRGVLTSEGIQERMKVLCKRAGVPHRSPHKFRHGLAMYLRSAGADTGLIQKILGHADPSTTERIYARWEADTVAIDFFDRMNGFGHNPTDS